MQGGVQQFYKNGAAIAALQLAAMLDIAGNIKTTYRSIQEV